MRLPSRPVRRILLPVDLLVLVVLAVGCAVGIVVGTILAPFGSRRRPLRVATFGLAYCAMEVAVLAAAGGLSVRRTVLGLRPTHPRSSPEAHSEWIAAHNALLAWALGLVLGAARRCVNFQVAVADPPMSGALPGDEPLLVLARHGGPGDSFALVHLLLTRYHRRVRVVLKDFLQLDPAIDVLLNRLGCCFLPSPAGTGEDLAERLGGIARSLGSGDALLLFPEGANWTPARRRRAIRHLRTEHETKAARAATLMANVMPPRPGGVHACLQARPELGVAIVAHAGLDRIVRVRQAWDQIPLVVPMTVRTWPAVRAPTSKDDRLAWLTTEWAIVDEWIDAHRTANGAAESPE